MINQIQTTNNLTDNNAQRYNVRQQVNPSFSSNAPVSQPDKFEKQSGEGSKEKSKSELAMLAVTGTCATFAGLAHHKLGTIIKSVGETPPLTPWARLTKISELTSKDAMTGLYNKATLLASIDKDYKNAMQSGKNFSVAMLDMDNFKGINEVFDHKTGDIVLKRIAANINEVAQKHGVKGFRYGGEEFVITLPGHDSESAKKIINEMAEAIKKDATIQSHLPEFIKKAQGDIVFLDKALTQLDSSIFHSIRKRQGDKIDNYDELAKSTISIIEEHIEKYKPADKKVFDEIVTRLKTAKPSELPTILSVNTKFGESTLGHELDKIHSQYAGMKPDLQKWVKHLDQHKMFTVSGGIVNLTNANTIKNSETPIKIADAALKSAKENGKNIVVTANDELIQKTIEKVDK